MSPPPLTTTPKPKPHRMPKGLISLHFLFGGWGGGRGVIRCVIKFDQIGKCMNK